MTADLRWSRRLFDLHALLCQNGIETLAALVACTSEELVCAGMPVEHAKNIYAAAQQQARRVAARKMSPAQGTVNSSLIIRQQLLESGDICNDSSDSLCKWMHQTNVVEQSEQQLAVEQTQTKAVDQPEAVNKTKAVEG
mmetsp:Transcript_7570/g.13010  ORF Transcript_7570/g.13010 Transcript_7570/m.13010 type:complete len:139 (+) Transcript_7570:317-733(+)